MSRNWQLLCYVIAAVAFALAVLDIEIRPPRRGRLYGWRFWIALGLLAVTMVPLVSTINMPA
jgi:hypothetical protein